MTVCRRFRELKATYKQGWRKPEALRADGDMWGAIRECMQSRGWHTVEVHKLPAHVPPERVGIDIAYDDWLGNAKADMFASVARQMKGQTRELDSWLDQARTRHAQLVWKVQLMMVRIVGFATKQRAIREKVGTVVVNHPAEPCDGQSFAFQRWQATIPQVQAESGDQAIALFVTESEWCEATPHGISWLELRVAFWQWTREKGVNPPRGPGTTVR
eukprot:6739933-Alexandrium_andersonii.AAC.1